MSEKRKQRSDVKYIAKCGLVSLSRCRLRTANLEECKTCQYVKRWNDKWKMINRKPHRKCSMCGEFKPVDQFYPKHRIYKDKVYDLLECRCKECRKILYVMAKEKRQPNTL